MRTVLRVVAFVFALLAAWLLVFRPAPTDRATVPGTNVPALVLPETQDSLDLTVVGALDHPTVYAVELRPAPDHRILALDPSTGVVETVRPLADTEQVVGLALSPDASGLAVAYLPDVTVQGSGLALLPLDGGGLEMVVDAQAGIYLTDPLWADEATVLLTRTDIRAEPVFDIVRVDVTTGAVAPVVAQAVTPALADGALHFLAPDEQANGRAVRRLDADGGITPVVRAEGDATIDHLLAFPAGDLLFAVHQVDEGAIVVGAPAWAHVGPSVWWTAPARAAAPSAWGLASSSVLDAVVTRRGDLLAVDREGLSIARGGTRNRLLGSRTLVFVAG